MKKQNYGASGKLRILQAALDNGADSVYLRVEQLNTRARALVYFMIADLPEIVRKCSRRGVRLYLTFVQITFRKQESQNTRSKLKISKKEIRSPYYRSKSSPTEMSPINISKGFIFPQNLPVIIL